MPKSESQSSFQAGDDLGGMTRRLIAQDRYGFVLLKEAVGQVSDDDARQAWQSLNSQMALIPAGNVPLILCDGNLASVDLAGVLPRPLRRHQPAIPDVRPGGRI